ncbi:MAG: cation:proton antiporter [Gammaproteobacteria bacterium]|nr:cation:proton antiporter [Gammaproteobacteria bacterium]
MNPGVLESVLVLLIVSVFTVSIFRRFRLPAILAYLCVGVMVGPHGLAWVPDSEATRLLAEYGVVFLLFTVGLEFSLPRLLAMRHAVLGLGSAQVALTTLVVGSVAWVLGLSKAAAFVVGGAVAMSSTAIVIRQLTERLELNSRHGGLSVGILLFQDLAVIPFLILIPVLAGENQDAVVWELLWALIKGVVVVVAMFSVGHWILRPLFHEIASSRSSELFTLTALLMALAAAWITHFAGLSLALGAFLAGMMLGETEFRHQVEADIRPFRDVLLGLFFITIGMLLDLSVLPGILHWTVLVLVSIIGVKLAIVVALARLTGAEPGVAVRTGIVLAQAGEFGLVLLSLTLGARLLDHHNAQIILAAFIFSMALSPLMINYNGVIAKRFFAGSYLRQREQFLHDVVQDARDLSGHVIICGYGRIGQNIARLLAKEGFERIALDLDPVRVRDARTAGERVFYGDSTHQEMLEAAGIARARALVLSFDDVAASMKILSQARRLRPDIPILVRTRDDTDLERLQHAGATEVVPETLEASLMLSSHLLLLLNVPVSRVLREVKEVRDSRYRLLREYFHGQEDAEAGPEADGGAKRLQIVKLEDGAHAVTRTLNEIRLEQLGVEVTALLRDGIRSEAPTPQTQLRAGDTLVLFGTAGAIEAAEVRLLRG